ncbi:glycosyltransferase family 4 protein [Candidatus Gracilibacteria bacterium]|nr:glycosyltransferase family 4 protein [Candidatus Gracilibacteria bacterium]
MTKPWRKEIKIAVLHAFFRPKGGGEKLIFDIRDYYGADLFTGAIDKDIWDPSKAKTDSFVKRLYDKKYKFEYLHEDSPIPFWKKIKRQLYFRFSPKIKELNKYDVVIFSGNIAGVAGRITNPNTKKLFIPIHPQDLSLTSWKAVGKRCRRGRDHGLSFLLNGLLQSIAKKGKNGCGDY